MSTEQWNESAAALRKLSERRMPHWENYLGFYSSWLDGFYREPWAMLMPIDDHGFHRGDGVFEAARIHEGAYFDLLSHLERLKASAAAIGMELPKSLDEIRGICLKLARLCQAKNGILRLYVTRGPGGFSPNPKEVVGHQIYAAITRMGPPNKAIYENGCRAMISHIPAKDPFWSAIKSCNYLQNVMMKKECLEKGYDLAICVGPRGFLCEGSTENMMLVSAGGELIVPRFDYTLRGTTIRVVMRLAEELVRAGELKAVRFGDVKADDLLKAREAAFVGTTLAVLPMTSLDGQPIGGGKPGPVSKILGDRLLRVMETDQSLRTAIGNV
jgi:branched-chain amino acid aminotransferase